jgi:hypothetical protein
MGWDEEAMEGIEPERTSPTGNQGAQTPSSRLIDLESLYEE